MSVWIFVALIMFPLFAALAYGPYRLWRRNRRERAKGFDVLPVGTTDAMVFSSHPSSNRSPLQHFPHTPL
jgi:hypothetical protein